MSMPRGPERSSISRSREGIILLRLCCDFNPRKASLPFFSSLNCFLEQTSCVCNHCPSSKGSSLVIVCRFTESKRRAKSCSILHILATPFIDFSRIVHGEDRPWRAEGGRYAPSAETSQAEAQVELWEGASVLCWKHVLASIRTQFGNLTQASELQHVSKESFSSLLVHFLLLGIWGSCLESGISSLRLSLIACFGSARVMESAFLLRFCFLLSS